MLKRCFVAIRAPIINFLDSPDVTRLLVYLEGKDPVVVSASGELCVHASTYACPWGASGAILGHREAWASVDADSAHPPRLLLADQQASWQV